MRYRDDLVFSMPEFERRLGEVRSVLAERELDAIIVTTPENIFYLTGYQTSGWFYLTALVVPLEDEPFMVTRLLEDSNVQARTWIEQSHPYADTDSPVTALRYSLEEHDLGGARIGLERHCYFFRATEQEQLMVSAANCTFVDCSGLVEQIRLVKSDEEIGVMRKAASATEAGMLAGLEAVRPGVSENDVAAEMYHAMIKHGSEYPCLNPYVASGWRGALGHAHWERRTLESNEAVFLELGAVWHRYHAPMMRTVFCGDVPPEVKDAERFIQIAMTASIAALRPGMSASDVDALNRNILEKFPHGTQATRSGYSIGIAFTPEWGEGQTLSLLAGEPRYLQENMTFHLIPWLQLPGLCGVGLSETVRITDSGCESLFNRVERKVFVKEA